MKKESKSHFLYYASLALSTCFLLAVPVVICLLLGYWIDQYTKNTEHIFLIIGVIVGFLGSMFNVFTLMKKMNT